MLLSHRIRLKPTAEQERYFVSACGVARFAYNWALDEWQRQHQAGLKPTELKLRRQLNAIKHSQFPWMLEVTKSAPQQAIKNLGAAYSNFFADLKKCRKGQLAPDAVRFPKVKKKYHHDSFRADHGPLNNAVDTVKTDGALVQLPKAGWVRMCEEVRFAGRILSVTVARQGDAWFASFTVDVPYEADPRTDGEIVGIDLGINRLATLSNGATEEAPKPLGRYLAKLRRFNRSVSRKKRGSKNRAKAKAKLARLHRRISDIRKDALHKLTTYLTRYRTIVIEDINIDGMRRSRRVSRAISDMGFGMFRRQLQYKTAMAGSTLIIAARWFASSKICSHCDWKNQDLTLSQRTWTCQSCGTFHDRDFNASRNLARYAAGSAASACGAGSSGGDLQTAAKLTV